MYNGIKFKIKFNKFCNILILNNIDYYKLLS